MSNTQTHDLQTELATFERLLPDLLKTSEGRYVLISQEELRGTYDGQIEAIRAGYEKLGNVPFLVRVVAREQPVARVVSFTKV